MWRVYSAAAVAKQADAAAADAAIMSHVASSALPGHCPGRRGGGAAKRYCGA